MSQPTESIRVPHPILDPGLLATAAPPDFSFIPIRRLPIFLESSLSAGLQWTVFEPNGPPLWQTVQRNVSNYLETLFRQGILKGSSPEQAFYVRCDHTTMTQADINGGSLIVEVGIAPIEPAEFVVISIRALARRPPP